MSLPGPRTRSALLWGLVGVLTVLVAAQGYLLVGGRLPLGYPGLFAFALSIGVVVAASAYLVEPRLAAKGRT